MCVEKSTPKKFTIIPKAASRVTNPKIKNKAAKNSIIITRNATIHGNPAAPVKKPIVPL